MLCVHAPSTRTEYLCAPHYDTPCAPLCAPRGAATCWTQGPRKSSHRGHPLYTLSLSLWYALQRTLCTPLCAQGGAATCCPDVFRWRSKCSSQRVPPRASLRASSSVRGHLLDAGAAEEAAGDAAVRVQEVDHRVRVVLRPVRSGPRGARSVRRSTRARARTDTHACVCVVCLVFLHRLRSVQDGARGGSGRSGSVQAGPHSSPPFSRSRPGPSLARRRSGAWPQCFAARR
jgi:hypothetical protein